MTKMTVSPLQEGLIPAVHAHAHPVGFWKSVRTMVGGLVATVHPVRMRGCMTDPVADLPTDAAVRDLTAFRELIRGIRCVADGDARNGWFWRR